MSKTWAAKLNKQTVFFLNLILFMPVENGLFFHWTCLSSVDFCMREILQYTCKYDVHRTQYVFSAFILGWMNPTLQSLFYTAKMGRCVCSLYVWILRVIAIRGYSKHSWWYDFQAITVILFNWKHVSDDWHIFIRSDLLTQSCNRLLKFPIFMSDSKCCCCTGFIWIRSHVEIVIWYTVN